MGKVLLMRNYVKDNIIYSDEYEPCTLTLAEADLIGQIDCTVMYASNNGYIQKTCSIGETITVPKNSIIVIQGPGSGSHGDSNLTRLTYAMQIGTYYISGNTIFTISEA